MDNRNVVIREFRKGDELGICRAHIRSVREICSKDYSPEEIEDWIGTRQPQSYLDAMEKHGERFWVVDDAGTIAGFSGWRDGGIVGFYMHPEYTGRGLARRLFEITENDFVRRSGLTSCNITSTVTARAFYERMGFKTVRAAKYSMKNGGEVDVWEMIKHYGL